MPPRFGVTCFVVLVCSAASAAEGIAPASTSAAIAVNAIREPAGDRLEEWVSARDCPWRQCLIIVPPTLLGLRRVRSAVRPRVR